MSPEEKERRLRVVEHGLKTEFWRVTVEQAAYKNMVELQEVIDLHWAGEHEKAQRLAVQIKARQEVLQEPMSIVRNTKPLFDEWDAKTKTWVRKVKRFFNREHREENHAAR